MERIHKIWEHPLYQEQFQQLQLAEADRRFCRHTLEHFLDVARLAYISSLEENAFLSKEIIYAAALLHDIGRYAQISRGIPHEKAGADLAGTIMTDCGFLPEEILAVQEAILSHRGSRTEADAPESVLDHRGSRTETDAPESILDHRGSKAETDAPESILSHRGSRAETNAHTLARFLYQADKQSRCCFACPAADECNWSSEKKNLQILI